MKKKIVIIFLIMLLFCSTAFIPLMSAQRTITDMSVQPYDIDLIFHDIEDKLENADTKEEFNTIFKEALIELANHGLLDNIELEVAMKLICNDNNNYLIYGETSNTDFLGIIGVKFYELSESGIDILWRLLFCLKTNKIINFHINSWVTLGSLQITRGWRISREEPAIGNIKIIDSEGEVEYNSAYGHIDIFGPFLGGYILDSVYYCIGVKGFTGISIGNYYFGQADQVDIRSNRPNI